MNGPAFLQLLTMRIAANNCIMLLYTWIAWVKMLTVTSGRNFFVYLSDMSHRFALCFHWWEKDPKARSTCCQLFLCMSYLRESKYLVSVLPFHYIPQKLRGHLGISNVYQCLVNPPRSQNNAFKVVLSEVRTAGRTRCSYYWCIWALLMLNILLCSFSNSGTQSSELMWFKGWPP